MSLFTYLLALVLLKGLLSPTSTYATTVYNQNIFGIPTRHLPLRLQTISRYIEYTQPDIVTLQEVFFPVYIKSFPDSYQAYYTRRGPFIRGGLVTLVKKNLTTRKYSFTPFSNQGNIFSLQLTDRLLQKGFQQICIDNIKFCLTNTHLTANYFGSTNYQAQTSQISQLLTSRTPDLLIGDLNFPASATSPLNHVTLHLSLITSRGLDHAFVSSPTATVSSQTINFSPPVSDHSGFFLTLP